MVLLLVQSFAEVFAGEIVSDFPLREVFAKTTLLRGRDSLVGTKFVSVVQKSFLDLLFR